MREIRTYGSTRGAAQNPRLLYLVRLYVLVCRICFFYPKRGRCGRGKAFAERKHRLPLPQEGVCLKTRFGGASGQGEPAKRGSPTKGI